MVKVVEAVWLSDRVATISDRVLVLDARSRDEFNSRFISGAVHICCTGVILRRLKNGSLRIESLLNCDEDKEKYERAKISESVSVIVCDNDTQSIDQLSADSTAALLLRKISRECKFIGFLAGGYSQFQRICSHHCVMSTNDSLLKKRPSSLVLQLSTHSLTMQWTSLRSHFGSGVALPPTAPDRLLLLPVPQHTQSADNTGERRHSFRDTLL